MTYRITTLLATVAGTALLATSAMAQTTAAPAAPAPSPAPYPAMSATLAANPTPASFEAGPLGKLTVTGVLSGGGFYQDNPQYDFNANLTGKTGYGRHRPMPWSWFKKPTVQSNFSSRLAPIPWPVWARPTPRR